MLARWQLLEHGVTADAIRHRIATGRLHPLWRGVYSIGRPQVSRHGRWMAAVLSCGRHAALSHASAAGLWGLGIRERGAIEVSVAAPARNRRPGIRVHRRRPTVMNDVTQRHSIPATTPVRTLVDLASYLPLNRLEAAINEADKLDHVDFSSLQAAVKELPPGPGLAALRDLLDRRTYVLTDSELERRFLPIARAAGLPAPLTGCQVNGFKVDFYWPGLGLVVETDGLRYHRTPTQQARDRLRDQAHLAAGLTPLRFTHAQVRFDRSYVLGTLAKVVARLR